ncbi:hypothetical protein OKA04_02710 [Luteolibacter flavescens]|uniref:Uncharacterized protein n=1 Tax=Luteolibacter flavescens TaxID=1859460 RepID=A0ABT3FJ77_9BACT|nr:hypothetical protein [Luteolibacter flavescens]MCW1883622.1 hypothetical protein [Luteolibacter flavescens]
MPANLDAHDDFPLAERAIRFFRRLVLNEKIAPANDPRQIHAPTAIYRQFGSGA